MERTESLVALAIEAEGTRGKCIDYILDMGSRLKDLDIQDGEVLQMTTFLRSLLNEKE